MALKQVSLSHVISEKLFVCHGREMIYWITLIFQQHSWTWSDTVMPRWSLRAICMGAFYWTWTFKFCDNAFYNSARPSYIFYNVASWLSILMKIDNHLLFMRVILCFSGWRVFVRRSTTSVWKVLLVDFIVNSIAIGIKKIQYIT